MPDHADSHSEFAQSDQKNAQFTTAIVCKNCNITYKRRSDYIRHLIPKIKCPAESCSQAYRNDKLKDFLSHMMKSYPHLDIQSSTDYFKAMQEVNIAPIGGLCTKVPRVAPAARRVDYGLERSNNSCFTNEQPNTIPKNPTTISSQFSHALFPAEIGFNSALQSGYIEFEKFEYPSSPLFSISPGSHDGICGPPTLTASTLIREISTTAEEWAAIPSILESHSTFTQSLSILVACLCALYLENGQVKVIDNTGENVIPFPAIIPPSSE
ncbi:hypothetical protein BGW36DRAFT_412789 [Talaromyces proteolyticus]|uniref:Uncharacterized protein n=1 Tax=Talaromyces proteolyticus TaxID=1131652 RepID=A0AAD4KEE8_9EURO|nr:uncharacterized protein BGW36DRAFT_412789 [Talaromyces proteolyticus]KAH8688842.1 hypothetical protein BGW36DRAFT_412789 [Talaromyces proteolyticus]